MRKLNISFHKDRPNSPAYSCTPLIICAQQRSGTNALRSILGQTEQIQDFGEVFNDPIFLKNEASIKRNFFQFQKGLISKYPDIAVPNKENQLLILDCFLQYLDTLNQKPFILLDIKYSSWHHLNTIWHNPLSQPYLMETAQNKKIKVIHLIRRNTFRQYVSGKYTSLSKTWHYTEPTKIQEIPFRIDIEACENALINSQKNTHFYTNWLKAYPHTLTLFYEDIFVNGELQDEAKIALKDFLNLDSTLSFKSMWKKPNINYSHLIENKQEVIDYFSDSPFSEMVNTMLV